MEDIESCSICGEPATKYIGKTGVLPICSLPSCYEARIEEVNKMIKEWNNKVVEERQHENIVI